MLHITHYTSPLGAMLLAADEVGLTGIWFSEQKYDGQALPSHCPEADLPIFRDTKRWLDLYFSAHQPDFTPPVHFLGTPFQKSVWEVLTSIPYGQTMTYGQIARLVGCKSAQAVGGAVGRNPISVVVPCHRVIGADGSLTGYAGGLDKKAALLQLEKQVNEGGYFMYPANGSL